MFDIPLCSGYMAPEYAMDGLFSTKSDVFSFGVLVLEIVSGKKNRGFYNADHELNLLGYVSTEHVYMLLFIILYIKMIVLDKFHKYWLRVLIASSGDG